MQERQHVGINRRQRLVDIAVDGEIETSERIGRLLIRRVRGPVRLNLGGAGFGYRPAFTVKLVKEYADELLLLKFQHDAMSFTNASTSASVVSHEHISRAAPSGPTSL